MTDVFISYSRRDTDFVRRLHQSLNARGRDTWVDWEDIPLTAEWWEEIKEGIEAADSFAFVISPDSARSRICHDEVEHAHQNNKRIVPILRRDLSEQADREQVHWAINRHNWVFMREDDDFEAALSALIEAIDTDLDHMKTHTALLLRAKNWDRIGRQPSPLLRGADLRAAETWLAAGGHKNPQPTELHTAYVLASRQAANRFQRAILSSVSVALIVMAMLAVLSFGLFRQSEGRRQTSDQRGTAVAEQGATAEANLHQAWNTQALFLADLAQQRTTAGSAREGILLALEGLAHYDQGIRNPENHEALLDALSVPGEEVYVLEHDGDWVEGTWNHDGSQILSWSGSGVYVRDAASGKDRFILWHAANVTDAAWNPDETRLLSVSADATVRVWDTYDGQLLHSLTHRFPVRQAGWSPDGSRILTVTESEDLQIWDAATGDSLANTHEAHLALAWWNADGTQIATWAGESDGLCAASIWDAATLTRLFVLNHDPVSSGYWGEVAWTRDGTRILTSTNDHTARLWDAKTGAPVRVFRQEDKTINGAWLNADETRLLTLSNDYATVWDTASGELLFALEARGAAWSGTGTRLLTWGADVVISDATTGEEFDALPGESNSIDSAAWSHDERRILFIDSHQIRIWNLETDRIEATLLHHDFVYEAQWSPDGLRVLSRTSFDEEHLLRVWDIAHAPALTMVESVNSSTMALNNSETQLLTQSLDEVKIWDLASQQVVFSPPLEEEMFRGATWNTDETLLLAWSGAVVDCKVESCPFRVQVWDLASQQEILTISGEGSINEARWNADETRIMTSHSSTALCEGSACTAAVSVWDAQTGELLHSIPFDIEAEERPTGGLWSTDETRLLTGATYDGRIDIWDVNSGKALFTEQTDQKVSGFRWNKDETRVLVWSNGPADILDNCENGCLYAIRIIDITTGETLFRIEQPERITGVRWNADETLLLSWSYDGMVRVWDIRTGQQRLTVQHESWVNDAAWNPDETRIVSTSADDTAVIWDAVSGEKLLTLHHPDNVTAVRWNKDGAQVLTDADDGAVRLWTIDLDRLVALARGLNLRPLTNEDRNQYFLPTLAPTATPTPRPTVTPAPTLAPSPTPTLQPDLVAALSTLPNEPLFTQASGELVLAKDSFTAVTLDTAVTLSDFVVEAQFFNPFDASEYFWDYGFVFRDARAGYRYGLMLTSDKQWMLYLNQQGNMLLIGEGDLPNFNTGAGESNHVRCAVLGEQLILLVNGVQITSLDGLTHQGEGTVKIATGFFKESRVDGANTRYEALNVWAIGPEPVPVLTPGS